MNRSYIPGYMISQGYPDRRPIHMGTYHAVAEIESEKFFGAVQSLEVYEKDERIRIYDFLCEHQIELTYCLARDMGEHGLNLSSLDENLRKKSVDYVISRIESAKEIGSKAIQLVSGKYPGDEYRFDALEQLKRSLSDIVFEYKKHSNIEVLIEPLDYFCDKKGSLGTIPEALHMCESIPGLNVCLDTAHMLLNGENIVYMSNLASGYSPEFHFCNAILDKGNELFGDKHIPVWMKGDMDEQKVFSTTEELKKSGFWHSERKKRVFFEMYGPSTDKTPLELIKYCKNMFYKLDEIIGG